MYPYKSQFADEIEQIRSSGMQKVERAISGHQGTEICVDGKTLLNFCANNYLGLADSPELIECAKKSLDEYGYGMASVRFICGTGDIHNKLERAVSTFFKADETILYSSCFDANTGVFETILKEGDAVFSDELNHASIIDGIRLCKAARYRYLHNNTADLETQIRVAKEVGFRRGLIVTDGVFSMDGTTAHLKELVALAKAHDLLLMVDDSHATGVLGEHGKGSLEHHGCLGEVDLLTSTFGKALGGASGGFVAGRREIIEVLRQRSRPYLFSNSLPPMIAAGALYVIEHAETMITPRLKVLRENTQWFRSEIEKLGCDIGGDGSHPITPVMLYDEHRASKAADELFLRGVYVRGFTYPVVPKGSARIRVQLSSAHTHEQLQKAIEAFKEVLHGTLI